MSLNIGTLVGYLELDKKPFDQGMDDAGSKLGGLGKAALVAGTAVAAGLAAGAVKGVMAFSSFEGQMNEVFTLLPGISGDAMTAMTGQVKDFSKEFGVLPDEVVPALYQALSAGVPQDNVFAFLETAQKAAKGGVTELATAVDGISSVVNAYGSDVMDATKASDLMFTAVRLGKTNFEELSASLFNVTPTAAALGVEFGDVTAALASMTAQGVPTSVATTQLRQLLVELSKSGTKASAAFEAMADQTFKEFIAEGGNLEGALERMDWAVGEGFAPSLADLFGSVEAGSAALSLTGKSAKGFASNLEQMSQSAGATEAAFDQMQKGLGPIFDRVKANLAVFFIDVGERLAPVVEAAINRAVAAFELVSAWWASNGPAIVSAVTAMRDAITSAVDFIIRNWDQFKYVVGAAVAIMIPHFVAMGVAAVVSSAQQVAAWVASGAAAVGAAVLHSAQVVLMIGKWVLLGVSALASAAQIAAAWLISLGPIALVIAAVAGVVALVIIHFDTIKSVIAGAWEFIQRHAETAMRAMLAVVTGGLSELLRFIITNWDEIKSAVKSAITGVTNLVSELPGKIIGALGDVDDMLYDAGKRIIQGLIDGIKDMAGGVADAVGGVLSGARDLLPFSPAKKGPFSGRGWTTYSGAAIVDGLISGALQRKQALAATMEGLAATADARLGLAGGGGPVGGFPGYAQAAAPAGVVNQSTFKAEINANGVTDTGALSEDIVRTLGWAISLNGRR